MYKYVRQWDNVWKNDRYAWSFCFDLIRLFGAKLPSLKVNIHLITTSWAN